MGEMTYQDVLDKHVDDELTIVLGNGFSMAAFPDIFDYEAIYERSEFGERAKCLRSLFDRFETFDFEEIMERIASTIEVCRIYGIDQKVIVDLQKDQEVLKSGLITAITHSHPTTSYDIRNVSYQRTRKFISRFKRVFSVNYDILLYWAINKGEVDNLRHCGTKDGFMGSGPWQTGNPQSVFYLHGGLHLYEENNRVYKLRSGGLGSTIIEQLHGKLSNNSFPLFVSEPTCEKKMEKIKHNPYLMNCYNKLKSTQGVVLIHGHSLSQNDDHILRALKESSAEKYYVGIFDDFDSESNAAIQVKATRFFGKGVEFYDSSTAPIW